MDEDIDRPDSLLNCLSNIQSGKVFEVITKDQNYMNFKKIQRVKKFLIHIITQRVYINDELYILALFKDITFGVLYE